MIKLITIIALCLASTAHAKLGETRAQLIQRFGASSLVEQNSDMLTFKSKCEVTIALYNDVSIAEIYFIEGKVDNKVITEIVTTVTGLPSTTRYWKEDKRGSVKFMESYDHKYKTVLVASDKRWNVAIGLSKAIDGYIDGMNETPKPTATPMPKDRTPQDCGVIAAQNYARLKPVTSWCRIVAIRGTKEWGASRFGHAGVAFKYQEGGDVFFVDSSGSIQLDTADTTEASIMAAMNAKLVIAGGGYEILTTTFLTHVEAH